jgi:hypothetical protein
MADKKYVITFSAEGPESSGLWDGPVWQAVVPLEIASFRPEGSGHRPRTLCKLLYSALALHGLFKVEDRYVRCIHTGFQAEVYRDSCVELFIQPRAGEGYFNFEFNCGGSMLASYVIDPTRVDGRVKECDLLTPEEGRRILRYHSLPEIVEPEIEEGTTWYLEFSIPFVLLENYVGPIGEVSGQTWRANLYKCGNDTSHPHWGAWAPLSERNFHAPADFGRLQFEKRSI